VIEAGDRYDIVDQVLRADAKCADDVLRELQRDLKRMQPHDFMKVVLETENQITNDVETAECAVADETKRGLHETEQGLRETVAKLQELLRTPKVSEPKDDCSYSYVSCARQVIDPQKEKEMAAQVAKTRTAQLEALKQTNLQLQGDVNDMLREREKAQNQNEIMMAELKELRALKRHADAEKTKLNETLSKMSVVNSKTSEMLQKCKLKLDQIAAENRNLRHKLETETCVACQPKQEMDTRTESLLKANADHELKHEHKPEEASYEIESENLQRRLHVLKSNLAKIECSDCLKMKALTRTPAGSCASRIHVRPAWDRRPESKVYKTNERESDPRNEVDTNQIQNKHHYY